MSLLRFEGNILKMTIKDRIQYPVRLVVDTFMVAVRFGILLVLYYYIFNLREGSIGGLTFQVVAWSMFFYFSFMTLRLRDLSIFIMQDVRSGTLEVLFSKPISYLKYKMWWQVGTGLYSFVVATVLGALALIFFVGVPASINSLFFLATFVLVFFLCVVLSLCIYAVIGLLAFWIEDIKPIYWIVDKSIMILGGSYLPVALFPKLMYEIAIWSPFGATQFVTHTAYESWSVDYQKLIGIQLMWVVIFGVLLYFLFRRAHKKVSVNGG